MSDAEATRLSALMAQSPFLLSQGLRLISLDHQSAQFELDLRPEHGNSDGQMHGGLIATLLDAACGFPARVCGPQATDLVTAVTLSLTIDYLRPPTPGGTVRASGRVIGGGQKIAFCRGELHDATGALVAIASGSFKRLRDRSPSQNAKGPTP